MLCGFTSGYQILQLFCKLLFFDFAIIGCVEECNRDIIYFTCISNKIY